MTARSIELGRVVLVRMDPGEDVLTALRAAVEREGIRNGVILSGVGSLNAFNVHVVGVPSLPTCDVFVHGDGAYDILTLAGTVIEGRVHAHITFSDTEKAYGGHLEEGCRVLTFAVAVLAETPGAELTGWDAVGPLRA
ncbi:MAG TPA: PPC domain-containing DNA-binding protein [Armatimonadota bacterium]